MSISILRVKDAEGNIIEIPAIKGDKGDKGDAYILTEADKEEIANMAKPDIDQTYNPESENAQSGKAVAEAVSGKADVDAVEWTVLADVTLDETTANVGSIEINVDKEKADACGQYMFSVELVAETAMTNVYLMAVLRTGYTNNVLCYARGSCAEGNPMRTCGLSLRDGKTMYSIYRPFSNQTEFNSTATPETTTSFNYDETNNRRVFCMWFQSAHKFPIGTHIRLIGRR